MERGGGGTAARTGGSRMSEEMDDEIPF
jgi:hypothetical protein